MFKPEASQEVVLPRKFDLKWKIVSLYSLDFLEPVCFTFVTVILAFTAKGQWKRQYC